MLRDCVTERVVLLSRLTEGVNEVETSLVKVPLVLLEGVALRTAVSDIIVGESVCVGECVFSRDGVPSLGETESV